MALSPGTRVGAYEIVGSLGAGGMGEVYRARDTRLGRDVAIKVLPPLLATDPDALARFEREMTTLAALSHPHILAIHDVGRDGAVAYAVTELLHGETLADLTARGPLTIRKALDYGVQIARAIGAAHERGIVHRDLKPGNVFIGSDGHVKVRDFGLARKSESGSSNGLDSVVSSIAPSVPPAVDRVVQRCLERIARNAFSRHATSRSPSKRRTSISAPTREVTCMGSAGCSARSTWSMG